MQKTHRGKQAFILHGCLHIGSTVAAAAMYNVVHACTYMTTPLLNSSYITIDVNQLSFNQRAAAPDHSRDACATFLTSDPLPLLLLLLLLLAEHLPGQLPSTFRLSVLDRRVEPGVGVLPLADVTLMVTCVPGAAAATVKYRENTGHVTV